MKITQKRLKEIIAEEMSKLNETFGRHMAGQNYRAAQGFDKQAIQQLAMEFEKLILSSPAVKDIQPPREGSIVQACQMAVDAIEAGESVATYSDERMQESKKRNK